MKTKTVVSVAALLLPGFAAADWTKSYVIEWNEPAIYYGAETGVIDPGTDCPDGTNPEIDWIDVLIRAGYTREEAEWLRNPANPTRSPVHGQNQMAFRGEGRANVYTQPWTYPDPGLQGVTGKIAEGINLDGNDKTGFTSPDGEKGIDNTFYKTLGCWKTYRGPERLSSGSLTFNDGMRNGSWTTVIVVHGEGKDFKNDNNVKVGFYMSEDDMVKGGDGNVATDYTFGISPHYQYEAIFDAYTKNGVIISKKPTDEIMLRDPGYTRDLEILQAQIKLTMNEDGSLRGYIGGYRPWMPVYEGWVNARGTVIESLTWVELPGVYYALKRNADYSPPGANGEKTHISYALRVEALPAFVMTPDYHQQVSSIQSYKHLAAKPPANARQLSYVVDGIVPMRGVEQQAGPNAVILPPKNKMPKLK